MTNMRENRIVRQATLLIWAYLALIFLMLAVYKWQPVSFPQNAYLLLLNVNLIVASLFACTVVFTAARRLRSWRPWFAVTVLLSIGEIIFFSLDFIFTGVENDDLLITPPTAVWLGARVALLVALAARLVRTPGSGNFRLWRTFLASLGFAAAAVFTVAGLVGPLLREFGSPAAVPAPLSFLFANLAAFALMAVILTKGAPLRPGFHWPIIGFALYLVADLFYFLDVVRHVDRFCLWEMGYFCGYLFAARGALGALSREGRTATG